MASLKVLQRAKHTIPTIAAVLIAPASQAALVYIEDNRYIQYENTNGEIVTVLPDAPFGDFNSAPTDGPASQFSELTSQSMEGRINVNTYWSDVVSTSVFNITFTVDEITQFSVSANFSGELYGNPSGELYKDGQSVPEFKREYTNTSMHERASGYYTGYGVLTPDSIYTLVFHTEGWYGGSEFYRFNFQTGEMATPLPASILLLGSGLAVLLTQRRRKT
ncbi:MAG: VPLPA-CTERM sorting domain-containing protein [Pseudomonadota bacterium]|nr:VPLPA-CTERM sorting domain-containing protein [Pseudomonadota bacterium]